MRGKDELITSEMGNVPPREACWAHGTWGYPFETDSQLSPAVYSEGSLSFPAPTALFIHFFSGVGREGWKEEVGKEGGPASGIEPRRLLVPRSPGSGSPTVTLWSGRRPLGPPGQRGRQS